MPPREPGKISKTPGVCGGEACISGTRIPVWVLVRYRGLGLSDAQVLDAFAGLTQADLDAAWDYRERHSREIAAAIAENDEVISNPFGHRAPPRHLLGAPGGPQTWHYRGVDIEVRPYRRGSGVVWVPDPGGSYEFPLADPQDALGRARFWIDADEWTQAWSDPERTSLVHRLLFLTRRVASRAQFGAEVATECRRARDPHGWSESLGPVECMTFDDLALGERGELLDQVWREREREIRGVYHEMALTGRHPNPIWKLDGHTVETQYDYDAQGWVYQVDGDGERHGPFADEHEAMRDATRRVAELPRPIAVLGDVNPTEHDGGILYQQGDPPVYSLTYFDTYSDEDKVAVFMFDVEDDVIADLTWVDWPQLAGYLGLDEDELRDLATSDDPVDRANVYIDVGRYHGFVNLDQYQEDLTIEEADERWGDDVNAAHEAWRNRPPRNPHAIKERLLRY